MPQAAVELSDYPFLTPNDFRTICDLFVTSTSKLEASSLGDWSNISKLPNGQESYLQIKRCLSPNAARDSRSAIPESHHVPNENEFPPEEVIEEDGEALVRNAVDQDDKSGTVQYDVFLSPTYQVPVLYLSLTDAEGRPLRDIENVYKLLVPHAYKTQLQDMGIVGGISMADHPVTGVPTFFIHPCQTADALREVFEGRAVEAQRPCSIPAWLKKFAGNITISQYHVLRLPRLERDYGSHSIFQLLDCLDVIGTDTSSRFDL